MTEFEYMEAILICVNLVRTSAMDIITVFFAYVVVAYLLGEKLSRIISTTITTVYTMFLIGPAFSMYSTLNAISALGLEGLEIFPDNVFFQSYPFDAPQVLIYAPAILGWLASVLYLHVYQRRMRNIP